MWTLGIDLAAEARYTAGCLVEWTSGRATISRLEANLGDDEIFELSKGARKVGIDAPFGWPVAFVDAIGAHSRLEPWPGSRHTSSKDQATFRRSLSLRFTDEWLIQYLAEVVGAPPSGGWPRPLSVSTDKIGVTTMRCVHLLERMTGPGADRSGSNQAVEVYPAAALATWGLPFRGYKGSKGAGTREIIVEAIAQRFSALDLELWRSRLAASDHLLDSLIAAMVARAAAIEPPATVPPPADHEAMANREGWIHVPTAESTERLLE